MHSPETVINRIRPVELEGDLNRTDRRPIAQPAIRMNAHGCVERISPRPGPAVRNGMSNTHPANPSTDIAAVAAKQKRPARSNRANQRTSITV